MGRNRDRSPANFFHGSVKDRSSKCCGDQLCAKTNTENRHGFINGGADDSFFPTQKGKTFFFADMHRTAENDESLDLLPVFGGGLAMKQAHDAIFGALFVENFGEESEIFKRIMLKNQNLSHGPSLKIAPE